MQTHAELSTPSVLDLDPVSKVDLLNLRSPLQLSEELSRVLREFVDSVRQQVAEAQLLPNLTRRGNFLTPEGVRLKNYEPLQVHTGRTWMKPDVDFPTERELNGSPDTYVSEGFLDETGLPAADVSLRVLFKLDHLVLGNEAAASDSIYADVLRDRGLRRAFVLHALRTRATF